MAKRPKRPRDPNQLAKLVVDIATGEAENTKPIEPNADRRKGGLKGGKARAKKLSAAKRKAIAKKAAALCAANVLRLVKREVGSLDRVERMVKVLGFVNSDPDFIEQHLVINGASQLFVDVLGPDAGVGARSAVGMASLPLGASVEVEAILRLKE